MLFLVVPLANCCCLAERNYPLQSKSFALEDFLKDLF